VTVDSEQIYGFHVADIPDGWTVDGAIVLGRATDDRGQPRIFGRTAGRIMLWEILGILENERQAVLRQLAELPKEGEPRPPGTFWADGQWWPYAVGSEVQEP
jgi:hypothetical protein